MKKTIFPFTKSSQRSCAGFSGSCKIEDAVRLRIEKDEAERQYQKYLDSEGEDDR
jgi:hypothetical protein